MESLALIRSKTSKILSFRNEENEQKNQQAMKDSLEVLRYISCQGREENVKLTGLATQAQLDSRMLKALTIVATMYLPATFLAVSTKCYFADICLYSIRAKDDI